MDPTIGTIMLFAGNFAPRSWSFCDGQLLAISSNTALFSIIGTTYGGDGRTSFALPDLRGRTPIGARRGPGLSNRPLGQRSGSEEATVSLLQLPNHFHTATATQQPGGVANGTINAGAAGSTNNPSGKYMGGSGNIGPNNINVYGDAKDVPMATDSVSVDLSGVPAPVVTVNANGGSQPHYNMQPFIAVNYIIAMFGIYPSRS